MDAQGSRSRSATWSRSVEMLVNVGRRERTTDEYATLLARSGLRLAQTIPLGRAAEAMGHHLMEAVPV